MAKHHKVNHNGKNRRTGRKYRKRSKPTEEVKTRSIGKPFAFEPIMRGKRPTLQRCNCTPEQKEQVNQRLFAELCNIIPMRTWNTLTGNWERKHRGIPRNFARKHSAHLHHFRPYARERIGQ